MSNGRSVSFRGGPRASRLKLFSNDRVDDREVHLGHRRSTGHFGSDFDPVNEVRSGRLRREPAPQNAVRYSRRTARHARSAPGRPVATACGSRGGARSSAGGSLRSSTDCPMSLDRHHDQHRSPHLSGRLVHLGPACLVGCDRELHERRGRRHGKPGMTGVQAAV